MQIFQLKLVFKKEEKYIDRQFYYHILGAVLNLFENDENIYQNILKISFSFDKSYFYVYLSVFGKKIFNEVVSILLNKKNIVFSVNSFRFELVQLDFNFRILDLEKISLKLIDKFGLRFLSPTQIRNQNKIFTLPVPERFLYSVYQKLEKIGIDIDLDKKDFKKWLQYSVIPSKFNIKTEKVEIKKSFRAGVVGEIYYMVYDKNEKYQQVLNLILEAIPYLGIGSGTRLGLGNVMKI